MLSEHRADRETRVAGNQRAGIGARSRREVGIDGFEGTRTSASAVTIFTGDSHQLTEIRDVHRQHLQLHGAPAFCAHVSPNQAD